MTKPTDVSRVTCQYQQVCHDSQIINASQKGHRDLLISGEQSEESHVPPIVSEMTFHMKFQTSFLLICKLQLLIY